MQRDGVQHERWLTIAKEGRSVRVLKSQPSTQVPRGALRHGSKILLVWVVLQLGCTEPSFGAGDAGGAEGAADAAKSDAAKSDAATSDAATSDAATSDAAGELPVDGGGQQTVFLRPDWAKSLLGDYVMRLRIFGREASTGAVAVSHETLSVVRIAFDANTGRVSWAPRMCRDYAELPLGVSAGVVYPQFYPARQLHVEFANGEFHTESDGPNAVGYIPETPVDCAPGLKQPRKPSQSWITNEGTCDCPPNEGLPHSPTDFRVIDSDSDNKPGFSVGLAGTVVSKDYYVTLDDSQVQHGKIAVDRHHTATYLVNQDSYQLACAGGDCTRVAIEICHSSVNTVVLVPLTAPAAGAEVSCEDMLRAVDAGGLLPSDPLMFPDNGC